MSFKFTYEALKKQFESALIQGYEVLTCAEYVRRKSSNSLSKKTVVNRVDIDYSVKKCEKVGEKFNELGIKASFFVRLHAPEYNPFSFENYRIIKQLIESGHEIGYHSEVIDEAQIWNEPAVDCLKRDIDVFNRIFGIEIEGIASHGGLTGLNNLDFWKDKTPSQFGLLYEGYDKQPENNIFWESRYVSDSEWTRWKSYDNGTLRAGDQRSIAEHLEEDLPLIYTLIHSDTYFENHFYE